MDKKRLKEILSEHADRLVTGSIDQPDFSINDEAELAALLAVAERVRSTLTPITPATGFEDELRRELLATAHLRRAEGYIPPNPERDLKILAAVLGFLVIFASVGVMWRLRSQMLPLKVWTDAAPFDRNHSS